MEFQGNKLRHELKYYLHLHEYIALRQRISAYLTMDRNSVHPDGYGIRSLYFDGLQQHSLYDKNNGVFRRDKYRIRVYNGSDSKITLERKSKFGDYINKVSAPLTKEEYALILAGDAAFLSDKDHPLLQEFYMALVHSGFRPSVIVDYMREAYIYELGNVRITFDKRLAAGMNTVDVFDPALVLEEALPPALTIMEIKYDSYLPDGIRQLVQPDRHIRSAISKFVICRELGLKHFKE
ncbi:polyphosphate polymerase domain-containing protein [Paenibacillus sp. SAF-054]|uniref:polyphosphate polymerase domain-containing protein n=1 Tax=unclassified Paenibacillus TaxID=185978 RepID=UPI003F8213CB